MNNLIKTVIVCSIAFGITSCSTKAKQVEEAERVEQVRVTKLEKQKIARQIELSTTLQGYETMNISPSVTGKIEKIFTEVGTKVNPGDMLVRMDQTQLNTTKLTFANLGVEYERIKALYETGSVAKQTYDQTKLAYEQTKQNLDFLTENTFVKAGIKGVVAAKNYQDGELYAGTPILTITQVHILKALVNIPESYFPLIKQGMKLELRSDIYPDKIFAANVEVVYPTVDAATHTFQAKLVIPNPSELLRPGMFVRTTIDLSEVDAILVPYQSVLKLVGSNERYVFINKNGIAHRKSVKLGQRFNEMIEIYANGINIGDELVTEGQAKLVDGSKLNVVK